MNALYTTWILLLFMVAGFSQPVSAITPVETSRSPVSYEEFYDHFSEMSADGGRVAQVENFSFQRDLGQFELHEGTLYLLTPVCDRTIGAIFFGKGTFTCTPPTKIEQDQLRRFYKTSSLKKDFSVLFLVFADSTLAEFQQRLSFNRDKIREKDIQTYINDSLDFLLDERGKYISTNFAKTFLEHQYNGLFYTHFGDKYWGSNTIHDPIFFKIDPYSFEEVSILQGPEMNRNRSGSKRQEVVCQFHRQDDYDRRSRLREGYFDFLTPQRYTIETNIARNLDFSAVTEIEFTSLLSDQRWIYFQLYRDMEVDSVRWNDQPVEYFKNKNNVILWIKCDPSLLETERRILKIYYHGDLIWRSGYNAGRKNIYIRSPIGWYPRHGVRDASTFDLTFHTPEEITLIGVGNLVSSRVQEGMTTTKWVSEEPIRNAAFNIGYYDAYDLLEEDIPPITILAKEDNKEHLDQEVSNDIVTSFGLFQKFFGEIEAKKLYVTETPFPHGMAFPGMLHLSWLSDRGLPQRGYEEIFRAHEVAHQWWGIDVDFRTYHDQWLSEGLATFCGLWYMQQERNDNKRYLQILREWKDKIIDNRNFIAGSGQEPGPIWLGYRNQSSRTRGDYNTIVYEKGAWVFHMLRNFMMDIDTMDDSKFFAMLRNFYASYKGKNASTEDFKRVVEKHAGMNMDWFFKQWVYGTAIPTYLFAYRIEETPDHKYLVHCKIGQGNVPRDFQMNISLRIDYGNNRFSRIQVPIKGVGAQFDLPLLHLKPQKIILNDLESVLGKVEHVPWYRF